MNGSGKIKIKYPKIIIVEGKDEEGFFNAFLNKLNLEGIQVAGIGGKKQIRPNLKALVNEPDFSKITSIGIIRDANADPKAAFQSARDALKAADRPLPKQPAMPVAGPPRIIIMLLPSSGRQGELEDLCLEAVQEEPRMRCVEEYFACLDELGIKKPHKLSKAKIAALLSYQEDPASSVGLSAQKGLWDFKNKAFSQVQEFLLSL